MWTVLNWSNNSPEPVLGEPDVPEGDPEGEPATKQKLNYISLILRDADTSIYAKKHIGNTDGA